ncbi:MAG: methyltransferase domain-containing protein [Sphingomonas sp.]|nr:methyltransferase domain-containing protein [Sphingomonas sp.]
MVVAQSGHPSAPGDSAGRRRTYDRIAPYYDLVDLPFEYARYRHLRPLLFDGLAGRILDAGVGTGRNIPFYPPGSHVIGIDVSPAMLHRAERRRSQSPATVQLRQMDVTSLDYPDATFDAIVATFLFCTLPDELQAPALCELSRVLKPGGILRLLDYRRPHGRLRRFIMRIWEPWAKWAFGASFDRRPEQYLAQAGLEMSSTRFEAHDLIALVEARRLPDTKGLGSAAAVERVPDPAAL